MKTKTGKQEARSQNVCKLLGGLSFFYYRDLCFIWVKHTSPYNKRKAWHTQQKVGQSFWCAPGQKCSSCFYFLLYRTQVSGKSRNLPKTLLLYNKKWNHFFKDPASSFRLRLNFAPFPIIYQIINNWNNQSRDEFAKSSPPGRAVPKNGPPEGGIAQRHKRAESGVPILNQRIW